MSNAKDARTCSHVHMFKHIQAPYLKNHTTPFAGTYANQHPDWYGHKQVWRGIWKDT